MSHELTGIVGFAFGASDDGYNQVILSNWDLAVYTAMAYDMAIELHREPVVVVQHEIYEALTLDPQFAHVRVDYVVYPAADGTYLDSEGVWIEARRHFAEVAKHHNLPPFEYRKQKLLESAPTGVLNKVFVIAQPYLHLWSCKRMIRKDGFQLFNFKPGRVRFDDSEYNTQPWTTSKLALIEYSVRTRLPGFKHGHNGQQDAS